MSQRSAFARPNQHSLALNSLMNAPPRPIELEALDSSGSPGLTDFGDLQSKSVLLHPSNANDAFMRNARQQQDPLLHWYTSQHAPWDPLQGRNTNVFRAARALNARPNSASFSAYRNHASPSECETTAFGHLPSDSGYGSLTRQSVVDVSLYGDGDQTADTASVSSHFAGIHFDRSMLNPQETWNHQASVHVSVEASNKKHICPHCHSKVKTKSELKKHEQKHTKPYHCEVPDCSRTEGFSTPNDVERHVRSCHPEFGTRGKYYKCTVANCRSRDKKWPRADNFRQHLKRVHQIQQVDDDIEKYVCEPQQVFPGADLAGLASVGPSLMSMDLNHNGMSPGSWSFNLQSSQQGAARDPRGLNDYMDQQMGFPQDVIAQQHFEIMTRAGDNVPNHLLQMSPIGLDTDGHLNPSRDSHIESQGMQDLNVPHGTLTTSLEEPSFFNEASMSDNESDGDDQSVIRHVSEPELLSPSSSSSSRDAREESITLEQPASRSYEEPGVTDGHQHVLPSHNVIVLEDDESSSTTSTTPASSLAGEDDLMQVSPDPSAPSESRGPAAPLNLTDGIRHETEALNLLKSLKEKGLLAGLLEQVDYHVTRDENTPKVASLPGRDASRNIHACPQADCDKSFPRQCELKKHMKRHAKPYGCTFPRCEKRFGSKNDWKRHENSQHHHLEMWKCNEKGKLSAGEPCNKAFNRREQFKTHLSRDHGIVDTVVVERKLDDCLDGRNHVVGFWCGFCKQMVQVQEQGHKAWLGRFNHIDGHFSVQMDISEWKSPDPSLDEMDVVLGDSNYSESSTLSTRAASGVRPPKRGADGGVHSQRPPKKNRTSALWYCCGCSGQQLVGFTAACLTPSCRGHEQCADCQLEAIPL